VFLFQAVRELLLNSVRHSGVQQARVRIAVAEENRIGVVVQDDSKGFDPQTVAMSGEANDAFGLFSIRERLEFLGGEFAIHSASGRGTQVRLLTPPGELEGSVNGADTVPDRLATALTSGLEARGVRTQPRTEHDKIRVLLVDDHRLVRAGLAGLLRSQPDMEVIGEASDGEMAVELARKLHPDVISMDITMPRMSGIDATRIITTELPNIRIIGLSMHEKNDMARAMREAGAAAYVPKDGPADVLLAAIRGQSSLDTSGTTSRRHV
jgi:CheY-like chemotaxis protein